MIFVHILYQQGQYDTKKIFTIVEVAQQAMSKITSKLSGCPFFYQTRPTYFKITAHTYCAEDSNPQDSFLK
jgi:uncharacterized Fe-S cluster-containing MiaB family protein